MEHTAYAVEVGN